jgi:hypothetical protein
MYSLPTNNETNIIRGIFNHSQQNLPQKQITEQTITRDPRFTPQNPNAQLNLSGSALASRRKGEQLANRVMSGIKDAARETTITSEQPMDAAVASRRKGEQLATDIISSIKNLYQEPQKQVPSLLAKPQETPKDALETPPGSILYTGTKPSGSQEPPQPISTSQTGIQYGGKTYKTEQEANTAAYMKAQAALDAAARARGEMPPSAAKRGWTPETWAAAERQSAEAKVQTQIAAQPTAIAQTATEKSWEQMTPQERFQRGEQIRAERDVPEMEAKATAVTTGKPGSRERQAAMDRYRAQQSGTMLPVPKKPLTPTIKTTAADTALGPRVSPEEIALRPERQAKLRAEMEARKAEEDKDREERRTILRKLRQQKWEQGQKQRLGLAENYYNILSDKLKTLEEATKQERAEARAKSMGFNLPMGHPRSRGPVNVAAIKPERLGLQLQSLISSGGGERTFSGEAQETTKETPKQPSWGERLKPHIITLMGAAQTHKIELSKEEAVSNSADRKRLLAQYQPGSDVHKAAQAVDEIMKTVRKD